MTCRRLPGAVALACILASSVATAQARDIVAQARQQFDAGVRLLEDSRFAEAASALERSLSLRDSPAALYNLGLAYRGMGSYRRALETFERFLRRDPGADPQLRQGARAIMGELRQALARVDLRVMGGSTSVLVDGQRVADGDTVQTLELDPGAHTFEARRHGFQPAHRELRLEASGHAEVALDVSANPLHATLVIDPGDPAARVAIDGQAVGIGQQVHSVRSGRHVVLVFPAGRDRMRRVLDAQAGSRIVVTFGQPGPGVLQTWWFWTGVGVLVAGAAVGVGLALRPAPPVTGTWDTVSVGAQ